MCVCVCGGKRNAINTYTNRYGEREEKTRDGDRKRDV